MTIERKVGMGIAGQPTGPAPDVAEVFSVHTYASNNADQGSGATQTINNGIDLAGEGGLVWIKNRNNARSHVLIDTERGAANSLSSNSNAVSRTDYTGTNGSGAGASFNSNGFTVGDRNEVNASNGATTDARFTSFTFRKKKKFFDVVTYTGNAQANRKISHNLGSVPAMMLIKQADNDYSWVVYHKDIGNDHYMQLNTTGGASGASSNLQWNSTTPTATEFTVHTHTTTNGAPFTHVAYLFADNSAEDADEQMIKCGSYTTSGSGTAVINLGWEPQFLLIKNASGSSSWFMYDNMRGLGANVSGYSRKLMAENSNAEASDTATANINVNATGFRDDGNVANNSQVLYMAIRVPMMKEPEAATDVFSVTTTTVGTNARSVIGFPYDLMMMQYANGGESWTWLDRLRGLPRDLNSVSKVLRSNMTSGEIDYAAASAAVHTDNSTGFKFGPYYNNATGFNWAWKRAKGYFDIVAYTGTGQGTIIHTHQLGVTPELIICKKRNATQLWAVQHKDFTGEPEYLILNTDDAKSNASYYFSYANQNTDTTFKTRTELNTEDHHYVAYLFATLDGISKVGSYTGNGSSQTIDCGFSAGARFILIKSSTDSGSWYIYDSARGIVSGNDPQLEWHSNAAQVSNLDSVDPHNSGFIVNQVSASNINASSKVYIFYAIA